MARSINGILYVDYFVPTGNPGEYVFESALFTNQADTTGNGAYDLEVGFILNVQGTDPNTFIAIPGNSSRYKLTVVNVIDNVRVSGAMIWDEEGEETTIPLNGAFCLLSKPTKSKRLSVPPLDAIYSDLVPGGTVAAMLNDVINIMDKLGASSQTPQLFRPSALPITSNGQTFFELPGIPLDNESTILTVNGVIYTYGVGCDYTITNNSLTWLNNSLVLDTEDSLVIRASY